jgi:hypothetical protein
VVPKLCREMCKFSAVLPQLFREICKYSAVVLQLFREICKYNAVVPQLFREIFKYSGVVLHLLERFVNTVLWYCSCYRDMQVKYCGTTAVRYSSIMLLYHIC